MIKIDIISGFLGAGKTTLIKKLLKEAYAGEQVVLIENEFGEIGIDGGFLKESGIEIREMNSGCICCSLVGDFEESLKQVVDTYHPDRIVIEPSGVGKLSDVVKAVEPVEGIEINSLTTVADAKRCKSYMKNFGEFYNNQVESAGTIILSRTDSMKEEKLEQVMELLKEKNPEAFIVTTPWNQLDGKKLLATMEGADIHSAHLLDDVCPVCGHHHDHEECHDHDHHHDHEECHDHHHHDHDCGCGHDHHHADDVFGSWGLETSKKFTKEEIRDILSQLPENVLRAKGMVPAKDGTWIYFDYVPEEMEIRDGAAEVCGKICVIGAKMDEAQIAKLFK